jgi:hypothetical protein
VVPTGNTEMAQEREGSQWSPWNEALSPPQADGRRERRPRPVREVGTPARSFPGVVLAAWLASLRPWGVRCCGSCGAGVPHMSSPLFLSSLCKAWGMQKGDGARWRDRGERRS